MGVASKKERDINCQQAGRNMYCQQERKEQELPAWRKGHGIASRQYRKRNRIQTRKEQELPAGNKRNRNRLHPRKEQELPADNKWTEAKFMNFGSKGVNPYASGTLDELSSTK
jgi:hypothetical protein